MKRSTALLIGLPVAALALGATACGSDKDDKASSGSTVTTAATTGTTVAGSGSGSGSDEAFVVIVQTDLDKVGCWSGTPDGEDGPLTQAAIREFQKAEGLTVDGELGAKTQTALETAAAAGTTVCTTTVTTAPAGGSTSTTTAGSGACAQVTEAMVASAVPGSTDLKWQCAVDAHGLPWIGGSGVQDGQVEWVYILEPGANVAFRLFDRADCASPPVPEALMNYCNVS